MNKSQLLWLSAWIAELITLRIQLSNEGRPGKRRAIAAEIGKANIYYRNCILNDLPYEGEQE